MGGGLVAGGRLQQLALNQKKRPMGASDFAVLSCLLVLYTVRGTYEDPVILRQVSLWPGP